MCEESMTRHAGLADGLHHRVEELAPGERVERGDGLVEQQQLGPLGERERERDLRLLAAGELADLLVERQPQALDPLAGDRVVPARVQLAAELERLADREALVQRVLLGDEADPREQLGGLVLRRAAEHAHAARARPQQADGELEQRRLAGAVGADERGHRARGISSVQSRSAHFEP